MTELTFGTAGIRGSVGPDVGQMNLALVGKVAWALGQTVLGQTALGQTALSQPETGLIRADAGKLRVIIGYDARPDSEDFARHMARVLSAQGIPVSLATSFVPTPLVAFAARKERASAAVVVTASHNPRGDNGIKIYDQEGVQISSPFDLEVANWMASPNCPVSPAQTEEHVSALPSVWLEEYFDYLSSLAESLVPEGPVYQASEPRSRVRLAYSPLHGVGDAYLRRAFLDENVELRSEPSQQAPDGNFPTLPFPNPEEPGALERLMAFAKKEGCDAAIANDPDADRFCACLPLFGSDASLVRLSGDAMGLLFADAVLSPRHQGAHLATEGRPVISTIVSSPALEVLARSRKSRVIRTLTGFKWLCRAALREKDFAIAYEEALGYCFAPPPGESGVLDKDGLAAAMIFSRLLRAHGGGAGLVGRLFALFEEIGQWGNFASSRRFAGESASQVMADTMTKFRTFAPSFLAGFRVALWQDFQKDAALRPDYLGEQDLLLADLVEGHDPAARAGRVLIRPSGTEPKLKIYVHLVGQFGGGANYEATNQAQELIAERIFAELLSEV